MRSLLFVAILLALTASARMGPRWNELNEYNFERYMKDYGRRYERNSEEYAKREQLFNANLAEIRAHNADTTQTYKKGVNQFSDWSKEEWRAYNGNRPNKYKRPAPSSVFQADTTQPLPAQVDWRQTEPNVISEVKNQGHCGNCWAVSATESIESYFALKTGQLPTLSVQQVTSCTLLADGCGGGSFDIAWFSFEFADGIYEEWEYPFTDFFDKHDTKSGTAACLNIPSMYLPNFAWYPKAAVTGFEMVPTNNATALKYALATQGPQSIAVGASLWMNYEGGIYQNAPNNQANWEIDHAVQVVGYGFDSDSNMNYWIVRNSWGTEWGEDGYIRLARPEQEPCGFNDFIIEVCGTSGILFQPARPKVAELPNVNP